MEAAGGIRLLLLQRGRNTQSPPRGPQLFHPPSAPPTATAVTTTTPTTLQGRYIAAVARDEFKQGHGCYAVTRSRGGGNTARHVSAISRQNQIFGQKNHSPQHHTSETITRTDRITVCPILEEIGISKIPYDRASSSPKIGTMPDL